MPGPNPAGRSLYPAGFTPFPGVLSLFGIGAGGVWPSTACPGGQTGPFHARRSVARGSLRDARGAFPVRYRDKHFPIAEKETRLDADRGSKFRADRQTGFVPENARQTAVMESSATGSSSVRRGRVEHRPKRHHRAYRAAATPRRHRAPSGRDRCRPHSSPDRTRFRGLRRAPAFCRRYDRVPSARQRFRR
jgi:hypothetical protein